LHGFFWWVLLLSAAIGGIISAGVRCL